VSRLNRDYRSNRPDEKLSMINLYQHLHDEVFDVKSNEPIGDLWDALVQCFLGRPVDGSHYPSPLRASFQDHGVDGLKMVTVHKFFQKGVGWRIRIFATGTPRDLEPTVDQMLAPLRGHKGYKLVQAGLIPNLEVAAFIPESALRTLKRRRADENATRFNRNGIEVLWSVTDDLNLVYHGGPVIPVVTVAYRWATLPKRMVKVETRNEVALGDPKCPRFPKALWTRSSLVRGAMVSLLSKKLGGIDTLEKPVGARGVPIDELPFVLPLNNKWTFAVLLMLDRKIPEKRWPEIFGSLGLNSSSVRQVKYRATHELRERQFIFGTASAELQLTAEGASMCQLLVDRGSLVIPWQRELFRNLKPFQSPLVMDSQVLTCVRVQGVNAKRNGNAGDRYFGDDDDYPNGNAGDRYFGDDDDYPNGNAIVIAKTARNSCQRIGKLRTHSIAQNIYPVGCVFAG